MDMWDSESRTTAVTPCGEKACVLKLSTENLPRLQAATRESRMSSGSFRESGSRTHNSAIKCLPRALVNPLILHCRRHPGSSPLRAFERYVNGCIKPRCCCPARRSTRGRGLQIVHYNGVTFKLKCREKTDQRKKPDRRCQRVGLFLIIFPATTYSPTGLPLQYHRRWRA